MYRNVTQGIKCENQNWIREKVKGTRSCEVLIIIIIIIIISATGIIPKSLSQRLKRLNLHPNTYIQMLTVAILGTCSIVRNFLNYT
jgi:hypothetical protein